MYPQVARIISNWEDTQGMVHDMITTVHVNINKDNRHCHGMYITICLKLRLHMTLYILPKIYIYMLLYILDITLYNQRRSPGVRYDSL